MKTIKLFLPGDVTVDKMAFINELSKSLPTLSFHAEYERDENPYLTEDMLSAETAAFIISLERPDILTLLVMSLHKKIPILFFFEKSPTDLEIKDQYFLNRLVISDKATFVYKVSCEKNLGALRLAAQIPKMI